MKALKWIGIFLLILVVSSIAFIKYASEDLPESNSSEDAEVLADKMLTALNKPAWDSLAYIEWTFFRGKHHYQWDKIQNNAIISWGDNKVIMDLDEVNGLAFVDGKEVQGEDQQKLISKAWSYWCNDSFWLYAPYKVKDQGTRRSVVQKDGKTGLKVEYVSGGVTPGDTYLWWLDENHLPESWQMWVKIIPLKGAGNSWENWKTLPGGALIATDHVSKVGTMSLSNIKAGYSLSDIDLNENAFEGLN